MSLLTIVQSAMTDLGLPTPNSVINNSDNNVRQILAFARRGAKMMQRDHDWQALQKEATFSTQAQEDQGAMSSLASDFSRFIPQTIFNRSKSWVVFGSRTPQSYAAEKGLNLSTLRDTVRIRGDNFLMIPAPSAGETIAFEYIKNAWATNAAGDTDQTDFAQDSDLFILDDEVLTLYCVYRFLQRKGMAYAEEFGDFERALASAKAQEKPGQILNLSGGGRRTGCRVADGNWPLT